MSQTENTLQATHAGSAIDPPVIASTEIQQVGDYKIIREIGRGAMGAVYLAEHVNLGRKVALKILPPELVGQPARIERFKREMAACGQLEHENIVLATDAGKANGYPYIAMQFIDGADLDVLRRKVNRFEVPAACEIIRQAALGLQHIHECNLVHRDIKPSNIVVTPKGAVKILDFGIARLRQDDETDASFTAADAMMGTPDYIAPEQINQCSRVDIRADIYSLGCTLYTLLSGHAPFDGPQYEGYTAKLLAHAEHEPTPLNQLCPELPEGLVRLAARMMAKSPDERPSTPSEVAKEIQLWAGAANVTVLIEGQAPRIAAIERPPTSQRDAGQKNRAIMTPLMLAGMAAMLLALGVAYFLLSSSFTDEKSNTSARSTTEVVTSQLEPNDRLEPNNRRGDLPRVASALEATTREIAVTNAAIDQNTKRIAVSLDALSAKFETLASQAAIDQPESPGDYYFNARVFGEKGNYRAAKQAFLHYFGHDLDVVDPHLHFIEFLKLQEGLAGAREIYAGLPGDKTLVSRRFATALLQDPEQRRQQLVEITHNSPDFAPAYFELSKGYSASQRGQQSLEDRRLEKECLGQFLELHRHGSLARYYLDKSGVLDSINRAKERLALLESVHETVLENPVSFTFMHLHEENWKIVFQIAEACQELFVRVGEGDDFRSTGTFRFGATDPRTGKKPPNYNVDFIDPGMPVTIAVKYIDVNGKEQGPFTHGFDSLKQRRDAAIATLKENPNGWVRLHKDGTLYFDLFFQWPGIAEFHFGVGQEIPSQTRVVPQADMNDSNGHLFYGIDVPATTEFISAQVKFTDGTTSDIVKIKRLTR